MLADVLLWSFLTAVNHFVLLFDTHSTHARADFSVHILLMCVLRGLVYIFYLCVLGGRWHKCHGLHMEVRGQHCKVSFLLTTFPWVPEIKLGSLGLLDKCL